MTGDGSSENSKSGYGKPPAATRFKQGRSGNPKGRPRGRHKETPYEAVLGQRVTIREDGVTKQITAAEAFLLQLARRGLDGDISAARYAMTVIAEGKSEQAVDSLQFRKIVVNFVSPGSVNTALQPLRMAKKLDPYRETARMALEPWIVEAALARLGDDHLTPEEQRTVVKATRMPWKVNWPDWWEVLP
ncbi:MAG: DUF5681 domain-containing protein [Sneathiella sp.]|nr:DUF5681 domain-containing protein [Sneathiella sp.]